MCLFMGKLVGFHWLKSPLKKTERASGVRQRKLVGLVVVLACRRADVGKALPMEGIVIFQNSVLHARTLKFSQLHAGWISEDGNGVGCWTKNLSTEVGRDGSGSLPASAWRASRIGSAYALCDLQ